MRFYKADIVLQEVPNEISLCFSICGCAVRCAGCHSPFLWKEESGQTLDESIFTSKLNSYKGLISCVLFMGGEWHTDELIRFLDIAQFNGLKTCLYTGQTNVNEKIKSRLTFLKTGPWIEEKGGLNTPTTNQLFLEVATNKNLNYLFNTTKL